MHDFDFERPGFQNTFRDVPELLTPRLLLREVCSEDVVPFFRVYSDPEVARYDNFEPMTRVSQATAAVESFKAELGAHERVRWAVTIRRSQCSDGSGKDPANDDRGVSRAGVVIGSCWLGNFDLIAQRCETGYELAREHWNRGYASEIVPALTSFAIRSLGMNRIEAYVDTENVASRHILEKFGFHAEGTLHKRDFYHGEFHDIILYALIASDVEG